METSQAKRKHLEDILLKFKISSPYYVQFLILMCFLNLSANISALNYVFAVEEVGHRCKDKLFLNETCSSSKDIKEKCKEWEYDNPHSFIAEFELACDHWKKALVGTVHNVGYAVGLACIGLASDKFGRKRTLITSAMLGAIMGVSKSFANGYWVYIGLEFLEAALGEAFAPSFILTTEIAPREKRVLFIMFGSFGSISGYTILPTISWLVPYWRSLLRVLYTPAILFLFYTILIDESPRWLLSKGKKDKAVAILKKMAMKNKVQLDDDDLDNLSYEQEKERNFFKELQLTFTSGVLVRRLLIAVLWWIVCTFAGYGTKINAVLLPGNKYINYGLLTIVEMAGLITVTFVLNRTRRKVPLICCFVLAAVVFVCQSLVPKSLTWLSVTLFLAGKMMATAYFTITYIYTSEIFPTYTRNSMHSLCSSLGRIGSILAPMTPLLRIYWHGAPSILFGCASLVAGLATMFAPDTADDVLPDTVRQAETLGAKD